MILRLLLLLLAGWIVWRLYRTVQAQSRAVRPPPAQPGFEAMAPCVACGTHLPLKALSADGRCGRCLGQDRTGG
ncbi:MAG TPA: hypothetical protein VM074_01120 [Solimonas sp.]|nr:hypothetical protein [Solimonas sp.]